MSKQQIFVVVGMAGSGKTTFTQRFYSWISTFTAKHTGAIDSNTGLNKHIFSANIDPAVLNVKMPLNLDIRDYIDYADIMQKHKLGPNDKINDSCNDVHFGIIDTPGQIEAFTWSSPGLVLVDGLKTLKNHKLKILYVIDSLCSLKPAVFIANMLYCSSLEARLNCEVILVFNKIDLIEEEQLQTLQGWFSDYELFRKSLDDEQMSSPMLSSLALYFEEFYTDLKYCFVSSLTGAGKSDFFETIDIDPFKIESIIEANQNQKHSVDATFSEENAPVCLEEVKSADETSTSVKSTLNDSNVLSEHIKSISNDLETLSAKIKEVSTVDNNPKNEPFADQNSLNCIETQELLLSENDHGNNLSKSKTDTISTSFDQNLNGKDPEKLSDTFQNMKLK